MHSSLLRELQQRRFSIRARWEALLRAEPVVSPLGHPDALVHLIDTTLEEIFAGLEHASDSPAPGNGRAPSTNPLCRCGRNPLLAYFTAGHQAMLEGLILAQSASAPIAPSHRDSSLRELTAFLHAIATREIEAICGVCQFRHLALAAATSTFALCSGEPAHLDHVSATAAIG